MGLQWAPAAPAGAGGAAATLSCCASRGRFPARATCAPCRSRATQGQQPQPGSNPAAFLFWFTDARRKPGLLVGTFLIGYGLARFTVEFFLLNTNFQTHTTSLTKNLLVLLVMLLVNITRMVIRPYTTQWFVWHKTFQCATRSSMDKETLDQLTETLLQHNVIQKCA